ncbi:MAG: hypothetical protein KKC46_16395, partial [Proteobacteria bacterium]|nr:hypothetical protein [Pseudomonadota bacterium]
MPVLLFAMLGTGRATDKYWMGGSNWWDYACWDPHGQPMNGDNVYLTQIVANDYTVYYRNSVYPSAVLNTFRIDATETGSITFNQGYGGYSHPLIANNEYVGYSGSGTYIQSSGTNTVKNGLYMSYYSGSEGTYELSGTGYLSSNNEYIGHYDTATFIQTGGKNEVAESLYLGRYFDIFNGVGKGIYELSGTGSLSAKDEYIGFNSIGIFIQMGGTNEVANTLYLGSNHFIVGAIGTYELSKTGSLSANEEIIGNSGRGTFTQNGGTNTVTNDLYLGKNSGSEGTYNLNGGSLDVQRNIEGGAGTSIINIDGGTLSDNWAGINVDNFNVGYGSGSNGAFAMSGKNLTAMNEYIGYDGSGIFTQTGGTNNPAFLTLGFNSSGVGTYELGGTGELAANSEIIGDEGAGAFTQTGGFNELINILYLGNQSGSNGTYELGGTGSLSADYEIIGNSGRGIFTQNGGTNTVTNDLYLGKNSGGKGTYNLHGGILDVKGNITGGDGASTLNIDGGNLSKNWLSIGTDYFNVGYSYGSNVIFSLSDKNISAVEEHIGYEGTGTIRQMNGSNEVTYLHLGYNYKAKGTYKLSGTGSLSADYEYIGNSGVGVFTQTGGTHEVTNNIYIAYNSGSTGTYDLQGGTLTAGSIINNGTFNYSGGTLEADITNNPAGTVSLSGAGTREVQGDIINKGTFTVSNTTAIFGGDFTNTGIYISDPSSNYFNTLTVEAEGYLLGGLGDNFFIETDFINNSAQETLWDTDDALLGFTGEGLHEFYLAGEDLGADILGYTDNFAWGTLNVEGNLNLFDGNATEGGAQYLSVLDGAV